MFIIRVAIFLMLVVVWPPSETRAEAGFIAAGSDQYVAGKLLVARPQMKDSRFSQTVIYMVHHGPDGAQGLVINKIFGSGRIDLFLKGFGVNPDGATGTMDLHYGGPVMPGNGSILYPAGPGRVAHSTDLEDLQRLVTDTSGKRQHYLFALGYAGWGPGQLEKEFTRGDWASAPYDETLVFGGDEDKMWQRALARSGLFL